MYVIVYVNVGINFILSYWRSTGVVRLQVITFSIEPWCMTEEYIIPKTITIYGASIYYSVGPKYCIIAFIGACIYKLSVIGNVIQSVLSL